MGACGKDVYKRQALGFAQCRGLLTSEKLSYEIAEGYRKRGIPCDVIYQDIGLSLIHILDVYKRQALKRYKLLTS